MGTQRIELAKKYHDAVLEMYKVTGDDESVCIDKLIYTLTHEGVEGADVYPEIPKDFNFDKFARDYAKLLV